MLDIKAITADPDGIATQLQSRGVDTSILHTLAQLYGTSKKIKGELDNLRAERKKISESIGGLMKAGKRDEAEVAKKKSKVLGEQEKALDTRASELTEKINASLYLIPNLPHATTPAGADENDNVEVRSWGDVPQFDFEVSDHVDLGEKLGILDFERGVKIAGARFTLLLGAGARLQRALINYMMDMHTKDHGYEEVWPPFLVNRTSATGTGNLPKFEEDLFRIEDPELFLIPTAEVPVTNIHAREVLTEDDLPKKWVAYTPCFRREAGSYGKDVRGMIRQHQFEKVELVQYAKPEDSEDALEALTACAEKVLQTLSLPYRVMTLCTGDLGFSAAKTYDLEVWLPSQNKYREISSCSNFTDFQARRASIRFKRSAKGSKTEFVHTINGSGLAVGRTIVAILENHQNADGTVTIPEPLRPYFGADKIG